MDGAGGRGEELGSGATETMVSSSAACGSGHGKELGWFGGLKWLHLFDSIQPKKEKEQGHFRKFS